MPWTPEERKAYMKVWREANKEKIREKSKEYCEANKEKFKEYKKEYCEANKEKINEYQKEYREANKEKFKEYKKEYCEANKDKLKEQKKEYREANKEKINEYQKEYKVLNKDKLKEYCELNKDKFKEYREANKDKINEYYKKRYETIKECNLKLYLINLQRGQLRRILNKSTTITKTKHSIEYIGCDIDYFINFIQSKMTADMNWNNIHLDHIKPVMAFNLDNIEEEFLDCCHYTNFQPLLPVDNMSKSNKWNSECESFWLENIKGKEYLEIYNPFKMI